MGANTPKMARLCYEQGKLVCAKETSIPDAVLFVSKETGMNATSAKFYIVAYCKMTMGKPPAKMTSASDAELYFEWMQKENDYKTLENALRAVQEYIDKHPRRYALSKLQGIVNKYRTLLHVQ